MSVVIRVSASRAEPGTVPSRRVMYLTSRRSHCELKSRFEPAASDSIQRGSRNSSPGPQLAQDAFRAIRKKLFEDTVDLRKPGIVARKGGFALGGHRPQRADSAMIASIIFFRPVQSINIAWGVSAPPLKKCCGRDRRTGTGKGDSRRVSDGTTAGSIPEKRIRPGNGPSDRLEPLGAQVCSASCRRKRKPPR